ncbi:MAG: hypothetical protein ACLS48_05295 [[Eubacterium] siraeum]
MPQRTAGYISSITAARSYKGKAWRFRLDVISLNGIGYYTQVTATDVDELYRRQLSLKKAAENSSVRADECES